ncbi:MAG: hypothetical protein AMXMBFR79_18170 [Chitinophagaceae bacterium]
MANFEKTFRLTNYTKIIDVGGTAFNWKFINAKPSIIIVNLSVTANYDDSMKNLTFEVGDGTKLQYKEKQFDIAYSNSVIEHLFTHENQKLFAKEIERVGKTYFVQTPAKEFFFEPHLLTPFIHWFPINIQRKLMKNFTIWGLLTRPSQEYIDNFLKERVLLSYNEFKNLFPGAFIRKEKFLWIFTKSYIAIKN